MHLFTGSSLYGRYLRAPGLLLPVAFVFHHQKAILFSIVLLAVLFPGRSLLSLQELQAFSKPLHTSNSSIVSPRCSCFSLPQQSSFFCCHDEGAVSLVEDVCVPRRTAPRTSDRRRAALQLRKEHPRPDLQPCRSRWDQSGHSQNRRSMTQQHLRPRKLLLLAHFDAPSDLSDESSGRTLNVFARDAALRPTTAVESRRLILFRC